MSHADSLEFPTGIETVEHTPKYDTFDKKRVAQKPVLVEEEIKKNKNKKFCTFGEMKCKALFET